MRLLAAENLKMKHTVAIKLLIFGPIGVILLAFIMNPMYLYGDAINWWYSMILPFHIAVVCALMNQKEQKKLNYQCVYTSPVGLKKTWSAKCGLGACYILLYAGMFGFVLCLATALLKGNVENGVAGTVVAVMAASWLQLWLVPVCLLLAKKAGFYAPVIFTGICAVFLGVWASTRQFWWLCPFSWTDRLMCTLAGYMPNGLVLEDEFRYLLVPAGIIVLTLAGALALYVLLTIISARIFAKEAR